MDRTFGMHKNAPVQVHLAQIILQELYVSLTIFTRKSHIVQRLATKIILV